MFSGGLCGVEELRDMMTLVGQMISKFKQKLSPVLDQAILPLVRNARGRKGAHSCMVLFSSMAVV